MQDTIQKERARRLAERVRLELAEHLKDTCANAPAYIDGYVESMMARRATRPRETGLHPQMAKLVRELALDAAAGDATIRRR